LFSLDRIARTVATPDDIRDAAREYIAVIENTAFSAEERLQHLRRSLDRLALLQHDISYTFDERDYPDTPRKDYNAVREHVSSRFPDLGHYNVPSAVTQQIAESAIDVGDAVDDIADIAIELYDVLWRFDHTSVDDALWYFEFSYTSHWEHHVRELQLCLQHVVAGDEDAV
jgi:hypothetical protein